MMKLKVTAVLGLATIGLAACSNVPGAGPSTAPAASGLNSSAPNAVSQGAAGGVGGANDSTKSGNSGVGAGGSGGSGSGSP